MKFALSLLHICNRTSPIIALTALVNYNVPNMMNTVIGGCINECNCASGHLSNVVKIKMSTDMPNAEFILQEFIL